jgi:hypothetical protein
MYSMPYHAVIIFLLWMPAAAGSWKESVGMGYTCSGAEFRGTVPNKNSTAAGCLAAAVTLNADKENCHGGVNYAISPISNPAACYVCRAPGVETKLRKNPDQISFVLTPLPPAPPPCPPPPPPAPIAHYRCEGEKCVPGVAHVSYTDPSCFGYCNSTDDHDTKMNSRQV